ncbi:MAG TPA: hypothetical protein VFN96_10460 [Gemmatimonadales bacterium]|nr:hypothetical protein [Gemmatimonadales bacterium]
MEVRLALHGDSLLLVYDPMNSRISIFDTAGRYRRQIGFQRFLFQMDDAFAVLGSGELAVRVSLTGELAEGRDVKSQYLLVALDGSVLDSIPLPSPAVEGYLGFLLLTADGERHSFPIETVFALLPDGRLVSGRTSRYLVTVSPGGAPASTIKRRIPPVPLSGKERSEWEAWLRYFERRGSQENPLPRQKPAFRDLRVDESGRIWVHRYVKGVPRDIPPRPAGDRRPLLTVREPNTFDLFRPEGKFLGTVELPPQTRLLSVRGDQVYVLREAEGGENLIERYSIEGLAGSS